MPLICNRPLIESPMMAIRNGNPELFRAFLKLCWISLLSNLTSLTPPASMRETPVVDLFVSWILTLSPAVRTREQCCIAKPFTAKFLGYLMWWTIMNAEITERQQAKHKGFNISPDSMCQSCNVSDLFLLWMKLHAYSYGHGRIA